MKRLTKVEPQTVADQIRATLTSRATAASRQVSLVAIDGRSGAGKSSLAVQLAQILDVVVVEGDDFYSGGTKEQWRQMASAERAAHCMDWRRQHLVLEELARGGSASWYPFDWEVFDGRLSTSEVSVESARFVILEGVYAARPELADLFDLRVLVDTPEVDRLKQLHEREGDRYRHEWESLWGSAEDYYFDQVMLRQNFDLVIETSGT